MADAAPNLTVLAFRTKQRFQREYAAVQHGDAEAVVGARCSVCEHRYESVADVVRRDVWRQRSGGSTYVDFECAFFVPRAVTSFPER